MTLNLKNKRNIMQNTTNVNLIKCDILLYLMYLFLTKLIYIILLFHLRNIVFVQ